MLHNDDTGMRILQLAREPSDKRTGHFHQRHRIALARSQDRFVLHRAAKHAGENLADLLKHRAEQTEHARSDVRCPVSKHTQVD